MKYITRIAAVFLFILFFGFALKNTQDAALRFFFDVEIHGPLVLMLLAFFVAGATLGVMAMTPSLLRHRRELGRQRKALEDLQKREEAARQIRVQPPQPDSVPQL